MYRISVPTAKEILQDTRTEDANKKKKKNSTFQLFLSTLPLQQPLGALVLVDF